MGTSLPECKMFRLNVYQKFLPNTACEKQHAAEDQLFYLRQSVIDVFQERLSLSSKDMKTQFGNKIIEITWKHGIRGNTLI